MPKNRNIRIAGKPREVLEPELLAQLVIMLGRQLAAEAESSTDPDGPPTPPVPEADSA